MNRRETGGDAVRRQPTDDQIEVAALASKVVELSERGAVTRDAAAGGGKAAAGLSHRKRHGRWWRVFYISAWLVTLSLLIIALLRIFYHDGAYFLTWINAFTRYIYLPAYVCVAWGAWQRRWVLAGVAGFVVACHLVWIAPNFIRDSRFDVPGGSAAASDSPSLRIFFANVWMENREYQALLDEIAEADPDVIVLVEFHPRWYKMFRESPLMERFSHGSTLGHFRGFVVVLSKKPLASVVQDVVTTRVVQTVEVPIGSRTLRLVGLHAPRPMYMRHYDYAGFWSQMIPRLISYDGPLVVVGDFNATEHSLVYKQLQEGGLRSAHDDRGRGYVTTWPNGTLLLPPIRIDQAFLSPEVECERIVEGRGLGSDHKPLILDVRLRKRR